MNFDDYKQEMLEKLATAESQLLRWTEVRDKLKAKLETINEMEPIIAEMRHASGDTRSEQD